MPSLGRRFRGLFSSANGTRGLVPNSPGDSSPSRESARLPHSAIIGKVEVHEVYSGRTGLDLPLIRLEPFSSTVRAAHTGPDGGLTSVGTVRCEALASIANLDDELSISIEDESGLTTLAPGNCSPCRAGGETCASPSSQYDWNSPSSRACGHSLSLYEKHPTTNARAGEPIADVFAVLARENGAVLALADGVNWGVGARLAARCAVRGAFEHLDRAMRDQQLTTSTAIFHAMLGALQSAHSLILQEGGLLTTLCIAVIGRALDSPLWLLCTCNVGDSLCFVYNRTSGVREVTTASHDTSQMRDMRDAGGALGPVSGRNPELHNLTCSMTFVEPDDIVFITSDGVSDNFDPVVGKFCLALEEKTEQENAHPPSSARVSAYATSIPSVNAEQRHALQLHRLTDVIRHGPTSRPNHNPSAAQLCRNLLAFAEQLSTAKRRVLEDPELYPTDTGLSRSEQRERKRVVRARLAEMPGKLDHASVVAYKVGEGKTRPEENGNGSPCEDDTPRTPLFDLSALSNRIEMESRIVWRDETEIRDNKAKRRSAGELTDRLLHRPLSPYETQPVSSRDAGVSTGRKKKHERGSQARHTIGVDIAWVKRAVSARTTIDPHPPHSRQDSAALRDRLRDLGAAILGGSARDARASSSALSSPQRHHPA